MSDTFPQRLRELVQTAEGVTAQHIAPNAAAVDADCRWPAHSLRALADAGLLGLHVRRALGGHEQGLLALAAVTETIGKACASSALCYGMHCVATAVIAAKATPDQEERYLRPIAGGKHITTLALSEAGTGSHFYLPEAASERDGDSLVVTGTKQFVTNGGHADSYVVSTVASVADASAGEFSCLVVDANTPGVAWQGEWRGFGMRGNSSRALSLEGVRVPAGNLLGEEGDESWYVFEVVAPYFLTAMSGTYLGVAQAALDVTLRHLRSRRHSHSGDALASAVPLQQKVSQMWAAVERTRQLLYTAARLSDLGDPGAFPAILLCKAEVADAVVSVTNEAMTICGGIEYRENGELGRLLRDARASHVMSPTTDMLRLWAGRALLGLPIL